MKRLPVSSIPEPLPEILRPFVRPGSIYNSSCSANARVYFLDTAEGFFLKIGPAGTLAEEAGMTRYFASHGLAPRVVHFESGAMDYLLTAAIPGEDCTHERFLCSGEELCQIMGGALRTLHSISAPDCPAARTESRLRRAESRYRAGHFDPSLSIPGCTFASAEEAWATLKEYGPRLRSDTLIHGDFCLPNVMVHHQQFAGFVDVGGGGLGDRHMDLFWCIWSLGYNLKTYRYTDCLLDAYSREDFNPDLLRAVAAMEAFG